VLTQEFERFLAEVEAPDLRTVAVHWQAVRSHNVMPAWRDIDPAAIKLQLEIISSWKYDRAADCFTGRLAGEIINQIFGRSLRGKPMAEFFRADAYQRVFARHKRVVTEPALYHGTGHVFHHEGRSGQGERIILPLANDGRNGDGIFGATSLPRLWTNCVLTTVSPARMKLSFRYRRHSVRCRVMTTLCARRSVSPARRARRYGRERGRRYNPV